MRPPVLTNLFNAIQVQAPQDVRKALDGAIVSSDFDINALCENGVSALHIAAALKPCIRSRQIIKMLLGAGANCHVLSQISGFDPYNANLPSIQITPLHIACSLGDTQTIQYFLETQKADLIEQDLNFGSLRLNAMAVAILTKHFSDDFISNGVQVWVEQNTAKRALWSHQTAGRIGDCNLSYLKVSNCANSTSAIHFFSEVGDETPLDPIQSLSIKFKIEMLRKIIKLLCQKQVLGSLSEEVQKIYIETYQYFSENAQLTELANHEIAFRGASESRSLGQQKSAYLCYFNEFIRRTRKNCGENERDDEEIASKSSDNLTLLEESDEETETNDNNAPQLTQTRIPRPQRRF